MKIRPATPADREAWDPMWKGYQDYYEVDLSATTDSTWDRLTNPKETGPWCLVYEDDNGELLGFTTYLLHEHTWTPELRCYLVDLYTKPESRGKRVGRHLIEAVHAESQKLGCSQTYWMTQHFNEAGRRLYDKVAKETPFIKYQM